MSVACVTWQQPFSGKSPPEQPVVLSPPPSLSRVRWCEGWGGGELRLRQRVSQGRRWRNGSSPGMEACLESRAQASGLGGWGNLPSVLGLVPTPESGPEVPGLLRLSSSSLGLCSRISHRYLYGVLPPLLGQGPEFLLHLFFRFITLVPFKTLNGCRHLGFSRVLPHPLSQAATKACDRFLPFLGLVVLTLLTGLSLCFFLIRTNSSHSPPPKEKTEEKETAGPGLFWQQVFPP